MKDGKPPQTGFFEKYPGEDILNTRNAWPSRTENILHSSLETFGGDGFMVNLEETNKYALPGIEGECFSFKITGNSMEPIIKTGDIVICRKLDSVISIKDNFLYVVITKDGRGRVKRVRRRFENDVCTHLILYSENTADYPNPNIVSVDDLEVVLKVFKLTTDIE